MDHEVDDPLGDSLDRDLAALLAAEPSAEFVARVRTRVAQEPAPSSWRWSLGRRSLGEGGWGFALAGAAAAVVLAVVVTPWTTRVTPTALPQQAGSSDVTLEPAPASVRLKPDTTRGIQVADAPAQRVRSVRLQPDRDARGGRLEATRGDAPPFREVLVSENEQRAFALLLTRIEQGRMPPVPPPADKAESIEPVAIEIPDLVIEPLPQIAALE